MLETLKRLKGSRTFWGAIGGMLVAVGSYFGDQLTMKELILALVGGIELIFLRDGMEKTK